MKMAPKDALSRASMGCKYAKRHHKVMTEKKVSLTPVRMQVRVKLDLHDLVDRGLESLWSIFIMPTRVPSGTVSAEVAQQPCQRGRQRRSEPVKEIKELESAI